MLNLMLLYKSILLVATQFTALNMLFSFGILMWEIWSRKLPYFDYNCEHLRTAIMNGARPTVPEDDTNDYMQLMKVCWSDKAHCRPTFKEVVLSLEEMSEKSISIESRHQETEL